MTHYAPDEFDQVPESSGRQGVHRTVTAPVRKRLWPIMAVGVAALLVGLAAFFIFPTLGLGPAGTPAAVSERTSASPSPTSDAPATPGPTSDAPVTPGPTSQAATTPAPQEPSPEPVITPSEAAVVVDKTQPVAVYNSTGVSGLANQVGGMVQTNGWALAEVGNWAGAPQQGSAIFYAGPAQLANAEALAGLLGIPTVVESGEFQLPLVVVLGPGYR